MALIQTASSTTAAQIVPPRNRNGLIFKNTDANAVYIILDYQTPTSALHSFHLDQDEDAFISNYDGEVRAVWAGDGSGHLLTTEY